MHADLWEAIRAGLIFRTEHAYKFLHDRVQEAAYSLIPASARAAAHLRIGRLLVDRIGPADIEANIFEIASQLNRGAPLITSAEERRRLARLNLMAARRAKGSTAYSSALRYLQAGRALLAEQSWADDDDLTFSLEILTAECELLTADTVAAEHRLSSLAERAKSKHDIVVITRLRLTLYTILARSDRSVEVCLEYLRRGGTDWSSHPTSAEVLREYDRIWSQIGGRNIEELVDLPLLVDPDVLDLLDVLAELVTPSLYYDENLCSLVICRMVNLSLEHGNTDSSCFAYVRFAMIAGPRFGNYTDGFRIGRLGYELVEKRGLKRYQARTYMIFGDIVMPWTRHVREGRELVRRAFNAANEAGDLTFAAYSCNHLVTNFLAAGDQLAEVQREAENGLEFAQKLRFGHVIDHIVVQLQLIRTLRGTTPAFGVFDDADFNERNFEHHLASNPILAEPEFWYCARKVQARFLAADLVSALDAASRADRLLWTSPSQFETAEYRFYAALTHAAAWGSASPEDRPRHFAALAAHHRQLDVWARNCPDNFENRAALVGAEIARIEGRELDAERLYEQAARSAHASGFVHNEALANELASRFHAARGFERIALAYLRDARHGYLRWGAVGKVRQLDRLYPQLREEEPAADPTGTIGTAVEHLDLATVIKILEAVSGEIVLETLIETLMRTAIEHAGAGRGLLILRRGDDDRIEAEATTGSDTVAVSLRQAAVTAADMPESIYHYVVRTKASVLLDDASGKNPFSADDYIHRNNARSILCLPLLKQGRLIGVLYLENDLAPHVFTPTRTAILRLLASGAALSLESTRLYSDLREREAKIRRLVDSNIIGIFIWGHDGRCVDANEAFLRILGYDRDDLVSGGMSWRELTPPEWHDADDQSTAELRATGTVQPYEKEYFHKGGGRVPILIGAATFNRDGDEGVAFVLDLTDRKRAEAAARESERRYHDVQLELVHANRIAMMGQLSASIAHEVNQPIAAVVTNAHAALRWLGASPPNIDEVRQALGRILRDGNRASDVVGRIRALVKKAPLQKDRLEINDVIGEIVALTHGEAVKNSISVRTQLAAALPLVQGDRVQLQQVILNLIINAVEAMRNLQDGARELLISTAQATPEGVFVAVRDSGPGLAQGSAERVFDAFYTTKPGGLGMGLSICRSIIDAHGGRLWVDASEPHGAIFKFTLPAHSVDAA
jgi:PAS domain S-box-containing protein